MKSQWHLIIATSFSMIVTLVLQCSLGGTHADDSLYQLIFADPMHEELLLVRSCISYFKDSEKGYPFPYNPHLDTDCLSFFLTAWLLAVYFYGPRTMQYTAPVFCTLLIAWLIARSCDGAVLYYPVNTITVHLLVWQCVGLIYAWQTFELPWFSLRLHQGSTCLLLAFVAFYSYELCIRYLSVRFRLGFAWFLSLVDILGYLYPGSPIRDKVTSLLDNYSYEYASLPPGFYITHELAYDDTLEAVGMGDFIVYNWMLLFIMPPFISNQEKFIVLIGHVVSVQIGFWVTRSLAHYWESNRLPAVPCPVVFVSLYVLVVDHFYGIL